MTFSSITFIIFFAIVLLVVLMMQSKPLTSKFGVDKMRTARHFVLLAASYVFYGWWDWRFCFLMLFMTGTAYLCAKKKEKKIFRVVAIVVPLAVLGIFKYFNFFIQSFSAVFGMENVGALNIILPVGISFYTLTDAII